MLGVRYLKGYYSDGSGAWYEWPLGYRDPLPEVLAYLRSPTALAEAEQLGVTDRITAYLADRDEQARRRAEAQALLDTARTTGVPVYLRYGALPRSRRSTNHLTGECESGLSVYRAYRLRTGEYVLDASSHELMSAVALAVFGERDQPYLVEGIEVGTGSDGEPLLGQVKILRRLGPCARISLVASA